MSARSKKLNPPRAVTRLFRSSLETPPHYHGAIYENIYGGIYEHGGIDREIDLPGWFIRRSEEDPGEKAQGRPINAGKSETLYVQRIMSNASLPEEMLPVRKITPGKVSLAGNAYSEAARIARGVTGVLAEKMR